MTVVMLYGGGGKDAVGGTLARVLSGFGGVQYYNGSQLIVPEKGKQARFYLYETDVIPRESNAEGIFILKNNLPSGAGGVLPEGFIPVLDAQNLRAAALLKGTKNIALTCGTSVKDTLSVASLDYTNAVISLQRGLVTLSGELLEPHDIKVLLQSPIGVFPLLACCAVLLLAGEPSADGYFFR